jgi:hypothetical protein
MELSLLCGFITELTQVHEELSQLKNRQSKFNDDLTKMNLVNKFKTVPEKIEDYKAQQETIKD